MFDPVTLIFVAVFIFVALRLRSVLGTRTGEEENHGGRYQVPRNREAASRDDAQEPDADDTDDNVVTLPNRGGAAERIAELVEENRKRQVAKFAKPDTALAQSLAMLMSRDEHFEPADFIKGAKMAYEMIVTAFADGDRATLKNLLAKDVYGGFDAAIAEREANGERVESSFVGVEKAEYVEVEADGEEAQVTVRFVSQIISTTRNAEGDVVDGDPEEVAEVKDVWTFARPVNASDPNWKLIATEAEG
ncbi:MAG: Tim44/TimA family putative adaptor protein [Pseudomonadota bacterium]